MFLQKSATIRNSFRNKPNKTIANYEAQKFTQDVALEYFDRLYLRKDFQKICFF